MTRPAGEIESEPTIPLPPTGRRLHVTSETGRLRRVIIGNAERWRPSPPINQKHRIYDQDHPLRPTRARLRPEIARLRATLEDLGVVVDQPRPAEGVPDQLTPRDIGFVVGDVFVVASMATECRREEWRGIAPLLETLPPDRVVRVPADMVVEGGDIVLDDGVLYVGVGARTTAEGAAWIRDRFADRYAIEIVPLAGEPREDVLHLDCAFVPVGRRHALVYPAGLLEIPAAMRENYEWIEVDRAEQHELGTNVLNVSPELVIARKRTPRVNECLRAAGIEVREIDFEFTPRCGGSLRCASLPLERDGKTPPDGRSA